MEDHISVSAIGSASDSVAQDCLLGEGADPDWYCWVGDVLRGDMRNSRPRDSDIWPGLE
jgi:hypothetical protein